MANGQPLTQGLIGDAWLGGQALPGAMLYQGIPGLLNSAYQGGEATRQLAVDATTQGYGNAQAFANAAPGAVQGVQNIANMIPGAMDASVGYAQALNRALGMSGGSAPAGQTQRVTDAALAASRNVGIQGDLYGRASDLLRPEIRSAWSARGLGNSGMSIGDESQQMQQLADSFAIRANQERNAFLGTAATAAGAEGAERVGLANVDLGYGQLGNQRGQLALQASMMPGQVLSQFQNVAGAPLDAATIAAQLQGMPLSLAGAGSALYQQGLQMPMGMSQEAYNLTRDPQKALIAGLSGTQQQNPGYRGLFGIPK